MNDNPPALDLLRRTEALLSALHGSVARHDNLAADLGCAGCELRDQIRAALAAPAAGLVAVPPTTQTALRDRIAWELRSLVALGGTPPRKVVPVVDASNPRMPRIADWRPLDELVAAALAVLPPPADRAAVLRDFLWRLEQSAGDAAAEKFLDDNPELRRLAAETAGPETQGAPGFVVRVLELFSLSHADAYGDLFWRVDDGQVRLFANVSDVFAWGGSDCEPITSESLPALEQAYTDLKAVEAEEFTAELYTARQRGMRPQGAAYPSDTHESWRKVSALYDACGPERELGLGNPKPAPAHAAPVVVQTEEA